MAWTRTILGTAGTSTVRAALIGSSLDLTDEIAIALGTITADEQFLDGTVTWNAGAVTFTALKTNVTDTASAAASLLADLQVGGVSTFSVTKAGDVQLASGAVARMLAQNRFRMLQSMVLAKKITTAQTIVTNTLTAVTFNGEVFDTDALHDNATNNSRLTAAIAGKYLVTATVTFTENTAATSHGVGIRKQGSEYYGLVEYRTPASASVINDATYVSALVDLTAGQYVECMAIIVAASGTLEVMADDGANRVTKFGMVYAGE